MKKCSFCNCVETEDNKILSGKNGNICKNCAIGAHKIFDTSKVDELLEDELEELEIPEFYPNEIKAELDQHVIGQENAKKVLSVAVSNHYRKLKYRDKIENNIELDKSNVLFIGPTGTGKTLLAQRLSKMLDVPLAISDATSLTQAGYVGDDVENVLVQLYNAADKNIEKAQKGIIFIDEIDKIAKRSSGSSVTRDVAGEGVQQALLKIIEGADVSIPVEGGRKSSQKEQVVINTNDILFICGGSFAGIEEIIKERLNEGKGTIGFNSKPLEEENIDNILEKVENEDLIKFGLIPEFIGRLHVHAVLKHLTKEDMIRILTEPKNSIVNQYKAIFKLSNIDFKIEDKALETIAEYTIQRKTGARGLRSLFENMTLDIMFNLKQYEGKEFVITSDFVKENLNLNQKEISSNSDKTETKLQA